MSVSARLSLLEERLFDEYSLGSMQPSDEWETDQKSICESKASENSPYDEQMNEHPSAPEESTSPYHKQTQNSFFSNQSSFVDYISNLVPTFSVEDKKGLNSTYSYSYSNATYSKVETKSTRSERGHSRYVIENPESIQERDEHREFGVRGGRYDEDCTRDSMSTSVEEISQISEITMDIPTIAPEERFAQCSALPTISESQQFDPRIATTCAAGAVRAKARCSAGTDTTRNKSEGNNDFIDFVFELVEDALCKPIKTSKAERKKVFMEAFHEESEKVFELSDRKNFKESSRETSRHSRSSRSGSTKRSTERSKSASPAPQDRVGSVTEQAETSSHSARRSGHSRMKVVDKPPLNPPEFKSGVPHDEELTMDWSKMMSLAEKQLEAGEKSIGSKYSEVSEASKISEKSSVYQSVTHDYLNRDDRSLGYQQPPLQAKVDQGFEKSSPAFYQGNGKASVASTASVSSSTHAALIDEIAMDLKESSHARMTDDVVKELRELSALDSSSFEEESRFILTSTLFRFVRGLIPSFSDRNEINNEDEEKIDCEKDEERAFDEMSETLEIIANESKEFFGTDENVDSEETALKLIRFVAFIYAFIFWPSGIARRAVPNKPLHVFKTKKTEDKPKSLLQLVSEGETR